MLNRLLFSGFFTGFLLLSGLAQAQKIEIGAAAGALAYKGDIVPAFHPNTMRLGGSLFFRYNLSPAVTFRAEVMRGSFSGNDSYSKDPFQQVRNRSFQTSLSEANLTTEFNFLNYQNRRFALNWTPYVFAGIGYARFTPTPKTADYATAGWVIPYGVGVKYQVNRPWSIGLEFGTRRTFSDNLDDLGETLSVLKLEQGDPTTRDTYYFLGFSISYTFYRIVCPEPLR
ncbi:type IX secretion system protein PorG [Arundinibacter roseus]|uniref:type IX secretion system protein PorG n=1 Tax=Arundinibacter roseus TaxID=2070510 RepID=UPI001E4BE371|nr:DUF6089 family protein [Arundinibacter roseus]